MAAVEMTYEIGSTELEDVAGFQHVLSDIDPGGWNARRSLGASPPDINPLLVRVEA
jgi:hypothetical protein